MDLFEYVPKDSEKKNIVAHHLIHWNKSIDYIQLFLQTKDPLHRLNACKVLMDIVHSVSNTEYLLLNATPRIPKHIYIDALFNLGTLLKNIGEDDVNAKNATDKASNEQQINERNDNLYKIFQKSLQYFQTILSIEFENKPAIQQITSIYTQLTYYNQHRLNKCVEFLHQALFYVADNPTIHYNLGFVYQKLNNLHSSVIHYKTSISLLLLCKNGKDEDIEDKRLLLNNYNGIASIYRAVKQWPESLHFLLKALRVDPNDPDINNQLGVVYTEMRRTDLAENAYKNAIKYHKNAFISQDTNFLLSEIYLNYGHMCSYNGDNTKSIDCYNEALKISPKFMLPFQNKIMNLNYLFDDLPDKKYITHQHKLINKLYKKGNLQSNRKYTELKEGDKLNIGIVSGDFVSHPVSFFISTFLTNFDHTRFNVTCYSEAIINTGLFNQHLQFKLIKNRSQDQASQMIYDDNIHILLDLSGHTALNRLDIFSMRPAPIQITYLGYPFTTGLNEMNYRITDSICDHKDISQSFYTEELLFLKNCFLCYDPNVAGDDAFKIPELSPRIRDNYLTIACFNRLNKMTNRVISMFNKILLQNKNVKFVFKTKALLNKKIQDTFLSHFDDKVLNRIVILDCTLSHEEHLETYNKVDIAIDTFPYSGTTTTCESLLMGVPVYSIYDSEYYFHCQNVSCSILKNSNLDEYICSSEEELCNKIKLFEKKSKDITFKNSIRNTFLNGKVCQKTQYMDNIQDLFVSLYNNLL